MEVKKYKIVYVERATKNKKIEYFDSIQQAENKRSFLLNQQTKYSFVGMVEKIK